MRALIFANGGATTLDIVAPWRQGGAIVIAADGGAQRALELGITPATVIGDLDSLPDAIRSQLGALGARFIVHPARKDETDLELALRHALQCDAQDVVIFCALGERWDQSLANLMLLTLPELRNVPTRIVDGHQTIRAVACGTELRIEGRPGDVLSLIALGGDARGVTIRGCEYALTDAVLPFGRTLGISNVLVEPVASVSVGEGIVLAIHSRAPA